MSRPIPKPRIRTFSLIGLAVLLFAIQVAAQGGSTDPADGLPIIKPGHEADVLRLLSPYTPGGTILKDTKLGDVRIERSQVRIGITAREPLGTLFLRHRSAPGKTRAESRHFLLFLTPAPGLDADTRARLDDAAGSLIQAIARNDVKSLWSQVHRDPRAMRLRGPQWFWQDGLVMLFVAMLFLLVLLWRQLSDSPPWAWWSLLGILILGVVLRLWLSPQGALGAWSYVRMSGLARQVEASPLLWLFGPTGDGELYRMDLMFWVHTGLAMVTPIVPVCNGVY